MLGLVITPTDIKSQWRESWKSVQVVNANLVDDPQSGNLVSPSHDNSGLSWTVSAPVKCIAEPVERHGVLQTLICETQTMSHIVESCPFTKLNGGLSQLHSADDAAIAWLTNYGS